MMPYARVDGIGLDGSAGMSWAKEASSQLTRLFRLRQAFMFGCFLVVGANRTAVIKAS